MSEARVHDHAHEADQRAGLRDHGGERLLPVPHAVGGRVARLQDGQVAAVEPRRLETDVARPVALAPRAADADGQARPLDVAGDDLAAVRDVELHRARAVGPVRPAEGDVVDARVGQVPRPGPARPPDEHQRVQVALDAVGGRARRRGEQLVAPDVLLLGERVADLLGVRRVDGRLALRGHAAASLALDRSRGPGRQGHQRDQPQAEARLAQHACSVPQRVAGVTLRAMAAGVSDAAGTGGPHAARPAPEHRARGLGNGGREARVPQPGRLDQGPDRDHDGRGGRARGEAEARRDDRGADLRQHRDGARNRRGAQGLPLHLHDARQDEPREDRAPEGLRRRGDHLPLRGRARVAGELLLRVGPARRGDSRRVQARPVPEPAQPGRALRDDRPRDPRADWRRARRGRDRGRDRRHDQRHRALHQGAAARRAHRRRRSRRVDLHLGAPRNSTRTSSRGSARTSTRTHSTARSSTGG